MANQAGLTGLVCSVRLRGLRLCVLISVEAGHPRASRCDVVLRRDGHRLQDQLSHSLLLFQL